MVSGIKDEEFDLGYTEYIGPLKIPIDRVIGKSTLQTCARCGVAITSLNDSKWEVFIEDGTKSQPICKTCNMNDKKDKGIKACEDLV